MRSSYLTGATSPFGMASGAGAGAPATGATVPVAQHCVTGAQLVPQAGRQQLLLPPRNATREVWQQLLTRPQPPVLQQVFTWPQPVLQGAACWQHEVGWQATWQQLVCGWQQFDC